MHFDINFSETTPFEHFWRSTGYSPAELILTPDMQQSLAWAGSVPHQGILYNRVHFFLELVEVEINGSGEASFRWGLLDEALDCILKNGARPFFELMGNPSGYFSDFNDDRQLHQWKEMVSSLARHVIHRYGLAEVLGWYFETWNEPDGGGWWMQWPADEISFCHYYDACAAGLWSVEPRLRLGGPGTCRHLSPLLLTFLEHVDRGANYFTGEQGTRIDFISVHEKGVRSHLEDLTPNSQGIADREAEIVAHIRRCHPRLADLPFMNNECDPQVGWWQTHTWHGTPYYAAIVAKIIHQHLLTLTDGLAINYALLSNDNGFVGYWGNRTLVTRFGSEAFTDTGQSHHKPNVIRELRQNGRPPFSMIKKPVVNVFALFSLLGERRAQLTGGSGEIGALATLHGANQAALLVYNSRDKITASGQESITLTLQGLPFDRAVLAHYRIDEEHGNPYPLWEAAGAPDRPGPDLLAEMRQAGEMILLGDPQEVEFKDGSFNFRFDLPLPGISLVLLTAKPADAPKKIEKGWVERYQGLHGVEEFVRWQGLESRSLRTYEVLAAGSPQGPYQRINPTDLLCTGYLHTPDGPGPVVYRIRAVDYWGRPGPESEVLSFKEAHK